MKEVKDDVKTRNIAYLTDRILVEEGKPQVYGTQFVDKGDHLELRRLENRKDLNNLRAKVGLETIEEYQRFMQESYKLPVNI